MSYFKSTDGHIHHWAFSLKRANLHLIDVVQPADADAAQPTGCLVVDSTRRGKRYPDALAKTVPIWCAVLNHASSARFGSPSRDAFPAGIAVPPEWISPSEQRQMEARLGDWVAVFLDSDLPVPRLTKPLCPSFVCAPEIPAVRQLDTNVHHIILVSASAPTPPPNAPPTYVQGAGDDHESWAHGLTPELYWRHARELQALSTSRAALEQRVDEIVAQARWQGSQLPSWFAPAQAGDAGSDSSESGPPVDAPAVPGTQLCIAARATQWQFSQEELAAYTLVVHGSQTGDGAEPDGRAAPGRPAVLQLGVGGGKRGLSAFSQALPAAVDAVTEALLTNARSKAPRRILVCCENGCDVSGALAVAILAACYDEHRSLVGGGLPDAEAHERLTAHRRTLSKDTTRRRLQWLVSAVQTASPSRSHLQRVNEYLMGPQRRVRLWE